ncbi:ArnT family glycosyltransferase [Cohnella silvisoli]|uniref:Glycosyltransferase family 39 protein n=1 Tax=Cohnella silvisoli TaxID=2873699 RepID=A0ABV1KTH7_9BACL|nr:glycosyltransferase family 39 protein [Cohnella silvisoli]MCD9022862.1 glycosyltransferase family 39 protein [Cohnella silvisoli]
MKLLGKIVTVAGCLFFIVALVSSFTNSLTLFDSALTTVTTALVTLGILLLVSYIADRYLSKRLFILSLISLAFLIRIVWILWIQTPPASDFLYMHTAAKSAALGDFSFADTEYFTSWVYQLGFTLYEALIIKLFGSSLFILKFMNVVFSVGTTVIVYFTAARMFNEFCGRIASLAYALYIPNIIMCSVLTNQHLSTLLFMLGCLFLIKGWDSKYRWIYIGLSFGIANIIRPLGSVFIIGLILFFLIHQLRTYSKPQAWKIIAKVAGVVAIFYLVQSLVSYAILSADITKYPLSNREPYWKFMVGLNAKTDGAWSMEDARYVLQFELGEERNRAELEVIKERLADKPELAALMTRKLVSLWGSGDASTSWSLQEMNKPDLSVTLNKIERMMYIVMSAFGVLSLLALYRMKQTHESHLYVILLLAYATVHLVIEIQTRYRLDLMPAFIQLQSYGVYKMYSMIQSFNIAGQKNKSAEM